MYLQKRVLNPQILLELICYVSFAVLMLYLVFTGKYQSYVTPRMVPYFYFTAAVMTVWALGGMVHLFRPQHKIRAAHCLVLAIPVILLLLPHTPINTADLSTGYLSKSAYTDPGQSSYETPKDQDSSNDSNFNNSSSMPTDDQSANNIDNMSSADTTVPDNSATAPPDTTIFDTQENESAIILPGLDVKNKKITVSNDDFGMWLSEIYVNMEKYKGYTVIMTGYVFKDPEILKDDEFVPARPMMTCCVADLAPAGLRCKYDKASELHAGSWVTVEGTLYIGKYEYEGVECVDPQISVTKITPAEKVEGYIYP